MTGREVINCTGPAGHVPVRTASTRTLAAVFRRPLAAERMSAMRMLMSSARRIARSLVMAGTAGPPPLRWLLRYPTEQRPPAAALGALAHRLFPRTPQGRPCPAAWRQVGARHRRQCRLSQTMLAAHPATCPGAASERPPGFATGCGSRRSRPREAERRYFRRDARRQSGLPLSLL